jgi:hypothetical protein
VGAGPLGGGGSGARGAFAGVGWHEVPRFWCCLKNGWLWSLRRNMPCGRGMPARIA